MTFMTYEKHFYYNPYKVYNTVHIENFLCFDGSTVIRNLGYPANLIDQL
jgi:hypothetical protein